MQAQDVTTFARTLLNELTPGQRWTDAQMILLCDRAQKYIIRNLKWPESRFVFQSTPNVQEYQIPEVIRILRVYINGQPIVRSDIPTLEGQQIQFNDQTGTGGGPGGLVTPFEQPNLAGGNYTPKWTGSPPASYPVMSSLDAPSPSSQPWIVGQRPRFYTRGGMLGFVPAPLGAYSVVVDCIAQPYTLTQLTDTCALPDIALDALAWKSCEYACFADPSTTGQNGMAQAQAGFQDSMREVRSWRKTYDGIGPKGPNILSQRSFYNRGQNKIGVGD